MSRVLVVAPHPDDETLGCGGTLLWHRDRGDELHWLIVTAIHPEQGFTEARVAEREHEIAQVTAAYRFASVHQLGFPTTRVDASPRGDLVSAMKAAFDTIRPEVVYSPYFGDAHSDHRVIFEAVAACTKWFRAPYVRRVLAYEALSETDAALPDRAPFIPTTFVNIEAWLDEKLRICSIFRSEMGAFPFPRSEQALRALAHLRGATAGFSAAEAFVLLRERVDLATPKGGSCLPRGARYFSSRPRASSKPCG